VPFATIRADLIGSAAYQALSGTAIRLHLVFESNFDPNRELILPQQTAVKMLGLSYSTVTKGLAELIKAGIIVKISDGWRPGRMGSQVKGRAAVYDLPHRYLGTPVTWKRPGDPNLQGHWRVHSERLRNLARSVSPAEAKVFITLHAVDRQDDGSPQPTEGMSLLPDRVGLPRATIHRAILSLIAAKRIEITVPGKGSKPALYSLAPAERKGVGPRRKKSTTTPMRR
jgi:hypothetical protein